jgi:hypothetical protein
VPALAPAPCFSKRALMKTFSPITAISFIANSPFGQTLSSSAIDYNVMHVKL